MQSPLSLLPVACDPCRKRKRKCDKRSPVCGSCQRLQVECRLPGLEGESKIANTTNAKAQRTPKAFIERLEAQVNSLKGSVASKRRELDALRRASGPFVDGHMDRTPPNGRNIPAVHFVGEEHAMGFIKLILGTIRIEAMKSLYVLKEDQASRGHSNLPIADGPTRDDSFLLDIELGRCLMNTYLRRGHPRHPFLAYNSVVAVCEKVLHADMSQAQASDEDVFRAYAILAIGAAYRNQELHAHSSAPVEPSIDPALLFSVAMSRAAKVNLLSGLGGIQNLLLISRYGFFCLTGASLWEISSLCIHMCIDNELHQRPRAQLQAFEEQMRRRVFWQCYNLNRHCATTLGLPFSIPDAQITVEPIVDIEDELLQGAVESLDVIGMAVPATRTSLSLMIWQTKLRQICSQMREEFKNLKLSSQSKTEVFHECESAATVWDIHVNYTEQLHSWRSTYPIQVEEHSQTELYLNTGWRDLHYFQEKLLLVRCSIEHSSTQLGGIEDPLDLVEELYESASAVVRLYSQLLENRSMEPTIGRMYRLLTAGLSALFTVVTEIQNVKRDAGESHPKHWWEGRLGLLKLCSDTLESMSTQFANSQTTLKYVKYFDLLCREVLKSLVDPSLWQKRSHFSRGAIAREGLQLNHDPRIHPQETTEDAAHQNSFLPSMSATTPSNNTVPDYEFIGSATYVSPDTQSISSPFAWLDDPNATQSFAWLTCRSIRDHFQPCYCGLASVAPMSVAPGLAIQPDGGFANFPAQGFDPPWMNTSTAVDDFFLADWGDVFVGSDKLPEL